MQRMLASRRALTAPAYDCFMHNSARIGGGLQAFTVRKSVAYGRSDRFTLRTHCSRLAEELMPPDYELRSYWKTRFDKESHFEWLGDGEDTILPHVRYYLLDSVSSARSPTFRPPRLLHIGAGTSSLSERLRELYHEVYGPDVDEEAIVQTDFAENLVDRMQAKEEKLRAGGGRKGMRWVCVDLAEWDSVKTALGDDGERCAFDLVVDKSTSDAISCGEDLSYSSPDPALHPLINEYLVTHPGQRTDFAPVEILAIHLASLVRPGGLWVALTFSSNRFAFLSRGADSRELPRAAKFWEIERVETVDAPTGMEGRVYTPIVQHYVFLLRRRQT